MQAVSNLSSFRSAILSRAIPSFQNPNVTDQFQKLKRFGTYPVTIACPQGQEVKAFGEGEGVKYACDLTALVSPCLIYAFGSEVREGMGLFSEDRAIAS